ncbi:hypothetical protein JXM67_11695 [candidate division WOR-3 bacterium]|nr:hypothetical protein [candidate division WOR-3 bacterium]
MGCSLDKQSITILRNISRGGWTTPADLLADRSIEEVEARLHGLLETGVIGSFHAVPFLPALTGGQWGRYAIRLHESNTDTLNKVARNLSGLEESLHNAVFFTRKFPRTTLFTFSRTQEEIDLLLREAGVETKPMLIRSYNFPFPASLSDEEHSLLRTINEIGEVVPTILSKHVYREPEWVEAKLQRLVIHSDNPQGVVVLRATIHWYRIDNFLHAHILLPVKAKGVLGELLKGLVWNTLSWPGESEETISVEVDFRGWGEFAACKERIEISGYPFVGFAMFVEERIHGKGFDP